MEKKKQKKKANEQKTYEILFALISSHHWIKEVTSL